MPSIYADERAAEREWKRRWDAATPEDRAALFGERPSRAFPWTSLWQLVPQATRQALLYPNPADRVAGAVTWPTDAELPPVETPGWWDWTLGEWVLAIVVFPVFFLIGRRLAFVLVLACLCAVAFFMGAGLVLP